MNNLDKLYELTASLQNRDIELKKQYVQLSKIVEAEDGYWDWDLTGDATYEYMSPKFWEIFGYDYREKSHNVSEWHNIIHPEDLKRSIKNFEKHVETKGKYPYYQEVRYKHKDGHWVWVLCKGKVVEWHGEKPIRMVGTHTDITMLKNG